MLHDELTSGILGTVAPLVGTASISALTVLHRGKSQVHFDESSKCTLLFPLLGAELHHQC